MPGSSRTSSPLLAGPLAPFPETVLVELPGPGLGEAARHLNVGFHHLWCLARAQSPPLDREGALLRLRAFRDDAESQRLYLEGLVRDLPAGNSRQVIRCVREVIRRLSGVTASLTEAVERLAAGSEPPAQPGTEGGHS